MVRTDWKTRLPASIILDKARQSGRVYQVGLNRRFAPVYKYAKELITAGDITPYLAVDPIVKTRFFGVLSYSASPFAVEYWYR